VIHEDDRHMCALLHIVAMKTDGLPPIRQRLHAVYTEFTGQEDDRLASPEVRPAARRPRSCADGATQ